MELGRHWKIKVSVKPTSPCRQVLQSVLSEPAWVPREVTALTRLFPASKLASQSLDGQAYGKDGGDSDASLLLIAQEIWWLEGCIALNLETLKQWHQSICQQFVYAHHSHLACLMTAAALASSLEQAEMWACTMSAQCCASWRVLGSLPHLPTSPPVCFINAATARIFFLPDNVRDEFYWEILFTGQIQEWLHWI